jgi:hypothetical protein
MGQARVLYFCLLVLARNNYVSCKLGSLRSEREPETRVDHMKLQDSQAELHRFLFSEESFMSMPKPTAAPTQPPTAAPTLPPTAAPTQPPTAAPTLPPTTAPTQPPTTAPTQLLHPQTTPSKCSTTPSITALEYLGAGYNIFEGNPRGSRTSELDPGFRRAVIKLVAVEEALTLNNEFAVPKGTELRYTTACQFESKSTEVSTTAQYQNELSLESTVTRQTSASFNLFGFKFGTESYFSMSEKYRSFAKQRSEAQTTTFQTRAFCTEFEARLQRFYEHEPTDAFHRALATLPNKFDKKNETQRELFGNFLDEYGTHYVNYVVLGAKQLYSLEMQSRNVLLLREMSIDVSKSTSSKTLFGYDKTTKVSAGAAIPGTPISVNVETDITVQAEGAVGGSTAIQETKEEKNLDEIKARTENFIETNVGGTPPVDGQWQTWAATAKDRPMPIIYELTELSSLMREEVAEAFTDYVAYYLENGRTTDDRTINDALHYGVAAPDGQAISSYTNDASVNQRALTELLKRDTSGDATGEDDFFRYNVLWDGSDLFGSALFLTLIRDNISPNTQEDFSELGLVNDKFSPDALRIPFAFSLEPGKATAAIFGSKVIDELASFSYLAADDIPVNDMYRAGVIHPQGYATNRIFASKPSFHIRQENDQEFIVEFSPPFKETPTFLAFPLWFPINDNYPESKIDVSVATRSCDRMQCSLQVGGREGESQFGAIAANQFLGFSFVSFDGALNNTDGIVHGNVDIREAGDGYVVTEPGNGAGKNFTATALLTRKATDSTVIYTGGVLIEFTNEFQDIPSVTVTPQIGQEQLSEFTMSTIVNGESEFSTSYILPVAIVEHVTSSQVLIKTAIISYEENQGEIKYIYKPVPFSFVAVGPMA